MPVPVLAAPARFRCSLRALATLVLLAGAGRPAAAQDVTWRPQATTVRVYAGVGLGSFLNANLGTSLGAAFDVSTPYGLLTAHMNGVLETLALLPAQTPVERNTDLGLLYGWRVELGPGLYASAATGLSSVVFTRRGHRMESGRSFLSTEHAELRERVTGIPVEVRLGYSTDLGGGLFVSWFRNYNRADAFGGLLVGLSLGF